MTAQTNVIYPVRFFIYKHSENMINNKYFLIVNCRFSSHLNVQSTLSKPNFRGI